MGEEDVETSSGMEVAAIVVGTGLVIAGIWDTLETVVVPRTVTRAGRPSRIFTALSWRLVRGVALRLPERSRFGLLAPFGPLCLIGLIALWALALVVGFGLVHWGLGVLPGDPGLATVLYYSGTTFFTLGFGDLTPETGIGRALAVFQVALGFGFLGLVVSYLPVLYSAFSRREATLLRLDARAGSEPVGSEVLRRHCLAGRTMEVAAVLREWEEWSAQQLESTLSFPLLAYYRSQHEHQSWLRGITAILDLCALVSVGLEREESDEARELAWQAEATFAMARHVIVDVAYIVNAPPAESPAYRAHRAEDVLGALRAAGIPVRPGPEAVAHFEERRAMYEPFAAGLARHLLLELPTWTADPAAVDNWRTSAWDDRRHLG